VETKVGKIHSGPRRLRDASLNTSTTLQKHLGGEVLGGEVERGKGNNRHELTESPIVTVHPRP